jgi:flagellar hook-basal body complex protein FliE
MPFNSSANNYNGSVSKDESFDVLRRSYDMPVEGFTHMPHPDLIYRPTASIQQYILPANIRGAESYYDQEKLQYLNHEPRKESMSGEGVGRVLNNAGKNISKVARKSGNAIKRSAVQEDGVLHQVIEKANDIVIPMVAEAAGAALSTYLTGDPTTGALIGKKAGEIGRKQLNQKTGYGLKPSVGVGKYKKDVALDKVIDKYVKSGGAYMRKDPENVPYTPLPKPNKSNPMSERRKIVAQVMKDKKLSLPQASKYVKEHNLF